MLRDSCFMFQDKNGFATMLILIIMSALTLTIILSFFEISYQSSRAGLEAELGAMARSYADSCGERALYYFSQGADTSTILNLGTYEFGSIQDTCDIVDIEQLDVDTDTSYYLMKSVGAANGGQVIRRVEIYLETDDAGASYEYKWTEVESFNDLEDYSL